MVFGSLQVPLFLVIGFLLVAAFIIRKYDLFGMQAANGTSSGEAPGGAARRDTNTLYKYGVAEMQGRRVYVSDGGSGGGGGSGCGGCEETRGASSGSQRGGGANGAAGVYDATPLPPSAAAASCRFVPPHSYHGRPTMT